MLFILQLIWTVNSVIWLMFHILLFYLKYASVLLTRLELACTRGCEVDLKYKLHAWISQIYQQPFQQSEIKLRQWLLIKFVCLTNWYDKTMFHMW